MQNDDKTILFKEAIKFGALRELKAAQLFIKQGYTVSFPIMSARYDFIAEKHTNIVRVQVKPLIPIPGQTVNQSPNVEWFIRPWSFAKGKRIPYSIKDCNVVMGIDIDTGTFAIVPVDEVAGKAS